VQRVGEAQDLFHRAAEQAAVGAQGRELIGVLEEREQTGRQHRLGGVVSSGDKLYEEAAESMSVIGASPNVVDRINEVRSSRRGSARRRAPNSMAYMAMSMAALPSSPLCQLGPPMDLGPVLARQPHQFADDLRREQRAHVMDELHLARPHDLPAHPADLPFERVDPASSKRGRQGPPVVGVPGRVHRQQHHPHHLEAFGFQIFEHHAAFRRREQRCLPGDVHHVRVLQDGPAACAVGQLLQRHWLDGAQSSQLLVGRRGDIEVGVEDSDGGTLRFPP